MTSRVERVVFVSEHYPPTSGGVATSTRRVAHNLQRLGVDVHVICFDHSRPIVSPDYVVREVDNGVMVSRVGPFFLKQPSISVDRVPEKVRAMLRRRAFRQMCALVQSHAADIVLSFYLLNAGFIATYLARERNLPLVAGVRGNDIGRNIFHTERFAVTQWVVGGADHVVCVNGHLKERLLLAFPDAADKSSVIPNSTLVPTVRSEDRERRRRAVLDTTGWNEDTVIAVFIGNLREKKGIATLLGALDALGHECPVRLLVVGPQIGSHERLLCGDLWTRLVTEGRCWHTGQVSAEEVRDWALGGDVVVMPSSDDGMANGLLEGMALGLCPVATTIFEDVVREGCNGRLVARDDPHALADVLRTLAADRAEQSQFGKAARESMLRWTPPEEAAAYLRLFQQVRGPRKKLEIEK